jgi:hypothetical protein
MVVLLLAAAGVAGALLLLRIDDEAVGSGRAGKGDLPAGDPATVASSPDSVVPDDVVEASQHRYERRLDHPGVQRPDCLGHESV